MCKWSNIVIKPCLKCCLMKLYFLKGTPLSMRAQTHACVCMHAHTHTHSLCLSNTHTLLSLSLPPSLSHSFSLSLCDTHTHREIHLNGEVRLKLSCIPPISTSTKHYSDQNLGRREAGLRVPTGSPSRGGDVAVHVWRKPTELATPFSLFLCLFARRDTLSQQVWSTGRTANQQEKNGGHDLVRECSSTSLACWPGPSQNRDLYLSGQCCQTGLRYQWGHSEQTEEEFCFSVCVIVLIREGRDPRKVIQLTSA